MYNSAASLRLCLESILRQSYKKYEVILIDDGSTDGSGEICDEYAFKYPNIYAYHQENRGVSVARNLGISKADGDWLVFCDSDDWVDKSWLSFFSQVQSFPRGTLLVNAINLLGSQGSIGVKGLDYPFVKDLKVGIRLLRYSDTLGYTVNKIFDNQIIYEHNIRFNPCLKFREDEDFVLQYLRYTSQIAYVPEACYNYIIPDLYTKYKSVQMFDASLSMYKSIIKIYDNADCQVCSDYRKELINAFIDTYRYGNYSSYNLTKLYEVLTVEEIRPYVSYVTYLILKLPRACSNIILLIKSRVFNLLRR